jgi:hypothetical protein
MATTETEVQVPAPRSPQPAETVAKPPVKTRPCEEYWDLERCAWVRSQDTRRPT